MAKSRFSAWIDRQSDENAEVIRRGRPIRERLMRIFDRQRLATWLFYAIITLFLVSCVTTGLALYELLIAGTQPGSSGSAYFYPITRGVVAAGTTFGIQTIALVLSLFFGGQVVRLLTASQVPKDLPFWSTAFRLVTSRGLQVASVFLIGGLLVPFLAFSIAFSYATFHHTLEREEEIRRKALIEIPQLVREARAPIQAAIRSDIEQEISSWVSTTAPLDSNGNAAAQDRLTLTAQLEASPLRETVATLRAVIGDEVEGPLNSEQRAALQNEIIEAQNQIGAANQRLKELEVDVEILNGQFEWEHGYNFDFNDPNAASPSERLSGSSRCSIASFRDVITNGRFATAAGILRTIVDRPTKAIQSGYNIKALDASAEADAEELRQNISAFLKREDIPIRYTRFGLSEALTDETFDVNATRESLREIADKLVRISPDQDNCMPGRGPYFGDLRRELSGHLTERDALRNAIIEIQDKTLPNLLDKKRQADEADAGSGARRKEAVEKALESGLKSLREFVQKYHGDDARLAGALAGNRLDVLLSFAAVIDRGLLSDVTARLRTSFQQMSCQDTDENIDTNREIRSYRSDSNCLYIAARACRTLSEVFSGLQVAASDGTPHRSVVHGLDCDGMAPGRDVEEQIAALHWANIGLNNVKLDDPSGSGDERIESLRQNAEKALEEFTQTQPTIASANLVRAYTRQVRALSETIANLDGRATVRRSWERMVRMFDEDIGFIRRSPAGPIGAAASGGAFEQVRADEGDIAGATGGINYVYEFYAFAIAVMIDVMIVLMAVCVVILRRSTLIGAEAHNGARIDEQVIESAFSGISREDPTIFSTIVQHFKLTDNEDYPVTVNISRIAGTPRRARIRRIIALLGNLVRKTAEDRYELRPAAQVYLQYLASDESHGVEANPEDLGGEPA